jgi:hypothetical protein
MPAMLPPALLSCSVFSPLFLPPFTAHEEQERSVQSSYADQ